MVILLMMIGLRSFVLLCMESMSMNFVVLNLELCFLDHW